MLKDVATCAIALCSQAMPGYIGQPYKLVNVRKCLLVIALLGSLFRFADEPGVRASSSSMC